MQQHSWWEEVIQWKTVLGLTLIPLFFLPITQDAYDFQKWTFLCILAVDILLWWSIRVVKTGTVSLTRSRIALGLGAMTIAGGASLLFASSNKTEAILSSFGVGTFAALLAIALCIGTIPEKSQKKILSLWIVGTGLFGLIALYQYVGVAKVMFPGIRVLSDKRWTPIGSPVGLILILIVTLPLAVKELLESWKEKKEGMVVASCIAFILMVTGIIVTLVTLIPQIPHVFLPVPTGWAITMESWKHWRQALVGVGAENFLYAFTSGRPIALNMTPLWTARFTTSASLLLHIMTTEGLLGTIAVFFFLSTVFEKHASRWIKISQTLGILCFMGAPTSFPYLLVVVLLGMMGQHESHVWHVRERWQRLMIVVPIVVILGGIVYGLARHYIAEVTLHQALQSAAVGNGKETYNKELKAIILSPNISRYHLLYSQTNLVLAETITTNLASREASPSAISQQDRQLVTTLIQQAIREGKRTVSLAPTNILAWENLARIYERLVRAAQGADTWTITTYQRAIQLDPTNPVLRIAFGMTLVNQKQFDRATEQFAAAASLKPDYANAYYNLANVARLTGDTAKAKTFLEKVLSLTPPGTGDYEKVQRELDSLPHTAPAKMTQ